ncbi:MAG: WYL domain-containing transcriptional regulator [Clostridia bacterium]|nr:WYL domain-containing transcriptional regulator [Clostridia bacterium]
MPNQKMKALYVMDYLMRNTDEEHPAPMRDIIAYLESMGISAERKSIYSDIEGLQLFGVDILSSPKGYYVVSRDFELPELKMLVDCVSASKFITEKKSERLIKKIEGLASRHEAGKLQRQVYIADRIKAGNEDIYRSVDTLSEAINEKKKVSFRYFEYDVDKKRKFRNGGNEYIVSPYSLTVSDENYYLISHYPKHEDLTHFRVDRMSDIKITEEACEKVENVMGENFSVGEYSRKLFSMYSGESSRVEILCENKVMNSVIDRFGKDVFVLKVDDEHFKAIVSVDLSPTFFAWIFTFGGKMKIAAPLEAKEKFNEVVKNFVE